MKTVLLAVGSRGDVEPMVALGKALKSSGMPVTVVALRDFAQFVEEAGLSFMPIDWSPTDETPESTAASSAKLAGGGMSFIRAVTGWLGDIAPQVTAAEMAAVEPGDLVIAGMMSIDDAVALQESRGCIAAARSWCQCCPRLPVPAQGSRCDHKAGAS